MVNYINGNAVRIGNIIKYNKTLYRIMTAEHIKPGKGPAYMQVKLRNIKDGTQTEARLRSDERVEKTVLEQVEMEYLYSDSSGYCFMNTTNYEQIHLNEKILEGMTKFFIPNIKVSVEFHEGNPISLEMPETVDMKVVETAPPLKGATASGSGKPATLETGLVVTVPQFIEPDETVRVNTATEEYIERVKK
ncbi:MAG TPA: elongation factor P [Nitrospinota bacterium]|jgi:elongation factor P|nr:elongation factor P [Nitrospinota bacterium]